MLCLGKCAKFLKFLQIWEQTGYPAISSVHYLKNPLIPTLHEGDIVVMDNMRTHHVKEVQTLLQRAGMKLLYLPAYSPDLNPIENMWSKIKAILRKLKIRLPPLLPLGIAEAFSLIRPSDCSACFSAAGIPCYFLGLL